jgi:hypothetical protein
LACSNRYFTWFLPLSKFDHDVEEPVKGGGDAEDVEDGDAAEVIIQTTKPNPKNAKRNARARDKVKLAREGLGGKQEDQSSGALSGEHICDLIPQSRRLIRRCLWGSGISRNSRQGGSRGIGTNEEDKEQEEKEEEERRRRRSTTYVPPGE